jgi:acyl-CoA synthetase (AMP-forming)/AMP-acid ligase II
MDSGVLPFTTQEAARRFGDATAYVAPNGWTLSFRDLDRASDEAAVGLRARYGVRAGDVVALAFPPGPEYLVSYLALAKLGAITAGVNDRLSARERAAVVQVARPRLLLALPEVDATADIEIVDVPAAPSFDALLARLRVADDAPEPLPADDDRDVAIVFTSGTTGLPKGARYANRQLAFITQTDVGDAWGVGGRSFTGTSFAHLGFMTKLPGNLQRGGTNFIMSRWRAHDALELLAEQQMTTVAGVPAQLALMLGEPDFDRFDLSSVQFIVAGGGPITPGLAEEARARFDAKLATRYACTEAGIGLGTAFDDPDEDAIVSVGRPHPAVDLAVLDEDDAPVATGEIGQVCLRSPAVMTGYWNDLEATQAAFTPDGHVRTGDLGWIDDRGRLRLVGRSKEMYVRGGYNVYPVEVEGVLSSHPGVASVAVVPRPDRTMGELGVAVVVPRDPSDAPSLDDLRAYARGSLAGYKLPDELRLAESLPLTAMEKIDRRALVALVADTGTPEAGAVT